MCGWYGERVVTGKPGTQRSRAWRGGRPAPLLPVVHWHPDLGPSWPSSSWGIWGLVGPAQPTTGVCPGLEKVEREPWGPFHRLSAFGNSAKGPPELGLWVVTLGTTALCWGCCSCLGVISHSPLCLMDHPEQGGGGGVGRGTELCGAARCKT